ncbi:MAG: hypothetical protein OXU61_03620 [Gammaproteobacteria bacterium]|nr:hypothetical protein [Gammaproteobacteria bacterium]
MKAATTDSIATKHGGRRAARWIKALRNRGKRISAAPAVFGYTLPQRFVRMTHGRSDDEPAPSYPTGRASGRRSA